ncbi:MAG: class I SAM-dependent methyltransferase [Candidatus Paceibacterota bacterium]|jgi:23S rRNA (cytosine1962-C5)-methyltransferase
MSNKPLELLYSKNWQDYELIDSGNGQKLERFGQTLFVRPDSQAIWPPHLPQDEWQKASATFETGEKDKGGWKYRKQFTKRFKLQYQKLVFWAEPTPFRHLGVFPEQAPHWDFASEQIGKTKQPVKILNLFGYTGLASLATASAGAEVVHVDASKTSIAWAKENQKLSGLEKSIIRWIEDDALKFVRREIKRGNFYDGIIMDPPKFGRGPKGEIWKFEELFPTLLAECAKILKPRPLFFIITSYASEISAVSLGNALKIALRADDSQITSGELTNLESATGRLLSEARFARFQGQN